MNCTLVLVFQNVESSNFQAIVHSFTARHSVSVAEGVCRWNFEIMSFWGTKKVEIDEGAKLGELRGSLTSEENEMLSDDDCHRFLRARNHDIHKTSDMVKKWAVWYHTPLPKTTDEEMTPANILVKQDQDKKEQIYTDLLPHSNVGEDKEGHPVYWEKTGLSKLFLDFVLL